jgi:hypothetical protein
LSALVIAVGAVVRPSPVFVVTMKGPTASAKFGNTAHEVVGLKEDLLRAILAIAMPDEGVVVLGERHQNLL